jgi:hypothetical protein
LARQDQSVAAQTTKMGELEGELAALRLQHQADLVTLKAAAAGVADREEALEASVKREKDLLKHRKLQTETARAAESGYLEKIERLRNAHAASQEALEASRKTAERLAKELEELRAALSPQEAAILVQREENEILRQKISEIGAAVIRAAGGAVEPDAEAVATENPEPHHPISEKATA